MGSVQSLFKAIGLASHGIGIGAFVYLRRIVERLIEDAHKKSKENDNWDEDKYQRAKVTEKIKLLNVAHLPSFLIDNSHLYGILSKGIHELTEDECQKMFDTIMDCIEAILDEKIFEKEREKKFSQAKKILTK